MDSNNKIIDSYLRFCQKSHAKGSGTANSYVTAINKLNEALRGSHYFTGTETSVWDIHDDMKLVELYDFVKQEQKKEDGGIFRNEIAKSYWQKGFCSAAVKEFARFLVLTARQDRMLSMFNAIENGADLACQLESIELQNNPLLLEKDDIDVTSTEGRDAIKEVKVRQNQYVFRQMILDAYQYQCCLTGLPVTEALRASHISPWASDKANRLNPENGLCLSATYDAAFDRYLISFDEDYRLILAPSLKDYCTNKAFQEQFDKFKGTKIAMPKRFNPSKLLLQHHRERLA